MRDKVIAYDQQGINFLNIDFLELTIMSCDDQSAFLVQWSIDYLKTKGLVSDKHLSTRTRMFNCINNSLYGIGAALTLILGAIRIASYQTHFLFTKSTSNLNSFEKVIIFIGHKILSSED